jgi:hypothetical protein
MPLDQCKAEGIGSNQEPRPKIKEPWRVDRQGIQAPAAGATDISIPNKFAIFRQPSLIIYRLVADGFASKVVQETHRILLGKNLFFR